MSAFGDKADILKRYPYNFSCQPFWRIDRHGYKIDFWIQLGVSSFWAATIVVGITAFLAGMGLMCLIDRGQINALKERKEFAEDRLKQANEQATGAAPSRISRYS